MVIPIIIGILVIWVAYLTWMFYREKSQEVNFDPSQYLKKGEIEKLLEQYYDQTEIDSKFERYYDKAGVEALLERYYDRTEINTKFEGYYDKAGVDALLEQYYDQTEIDSKFERYYDKTGIDSILEGYYNKNEIDLLMMNKAVPQGAIVMWSGLIADIPEGWALCDGRPGTPDLGDKFICGTKDELAPEDRVGGKNSLVLTPDNLPGHRHGAGDLIVNNAGIHNHYNDPPGTNTSENGAHSHRYDYDTTDGAGSQINLGDGAPNDYAGSTEGNHQHYVDIPPFYSGDAGAHAHLIAGNTGITGNNVAFDNRPDYYKLAFIMKL